MNLHHSCGSTVMDEALSHAKHGMSCADWIRQRRCLVGVGRCCHTAMCCSNGADAADVIMGRFNEEDVILLQRPSNPERDGVGAAGLMAR